MPMWTQLVLGMGLLVLAFVCIILALVSLVWIIRAQTESTRKRGRAVEDLEDQIEETELCVRLVQLQKQLRALREPGKLDEARVGNANGTNQAKPSDVYGILTQLVVHAEQTRWTRLYNLLVFDTILILAWAALFAEADSVEPWAKKTVMMLLCLSGIISGLIWTELGRRSSQYVDLFHKAAEELEKVWVPIELPRPYNIARKRREPEQPGKKFLMWCTSSKNLVTWTPLLFSILFGTLLWLSCT